MAKYGVWVQDPDYVPPSILILSEIGRGIGLFAAFPKLDLTPFGPVWEGQDGLVVTPLPVLVDGTHGTSGLDTGGRNTTTIRTTGELHQEI